MANLWYLASTVVNDFNLPLENSVGTDTILNTSATRSVQTCIFAAENFYYMKPRRFLQNNFREVIYKKTVSGQEVIFSTYFVMGYEGNICAFGLYK